MNAAVPKLSSPFELRSPQKGLRIKLAGEFIRLGRAEDNDVVISDVSVSRYHLNFHLTPQGVTVEDVGAKVGLMINGVTHRQAVQLKVGDRLQIGSAEYIFAKAGVATPFPKKSPIPSADSLRHAGNAAPLRNAAPADLEDPDRESRRRRFRLYTVGVLAVAVLYFGLSKEETVISSPPDPTADQIEKALQSEHYSSNQFRGKDLSQIQAEAFFLEALRDYNNGNFSRALVVLDNALLRDPNMERALEYRMYAEARLNAQITELMQDGQRSFSLLRYGRAKSQFTTVLTILAEQVPGYLQNASQKLEASRTPAQADSRLLDLPCERTHHEAHCKLAVELVKQARQRLGEEDTLK